jgi:hypothetical protein
MDDPFEKIAQDVVQKCERVECGFDEFVSGLATVLDAICERLDMARDEQRSRRDA